MKLTPTGLLLTSLLAISLSGIAQAKLEQKIVYKIQLISKFTFPGLTIKLPGEQTKSQPALGDDFTVSAENGIYGVALGSEYEQVEARFGSPNFVFTPSEDTTVLAYGRTHWLTFTNNKLTKVEYGTGLFNNTLVNYLEFDDRFDIRQWQVSGGLTAGSKVEREGNEQPTLTRHGSSILELHTDTLFKNNQKYKVEELSGFTLYAVNQSERPTYDFSQLNNQVLTRLNEQLEQKESVGLIDVRKLEYQPLAYSLKTGGKHYQLYDEHTLVEVVGNAVNRIIISPDFLEQDLVTGQPWQYGSFFYGMSKDAVLELAGDSAFTMSDYVAFERDGYDARVYFDEQNNKTIAHSMEVVLY